jgi:serine/threonine protein kinase
MSPPNQVQSASLRHPSDESLLGLARNQLGSDETLVVQRHVWHCKRCQGILDEFRMENAPGDAIEVDISRKAKIVSATTEVQGEESAKNLLALVPDELRDHSQYKVLRLIGQGGMGKVFLVEHKLTARKEVIKVVHPHLLAREDVRIRFQREIQAAAKLNHPNVVHTLTAIAEGSMIGLVMEYVQGESLFSIVKRVGPLPIERAWDWIKQIAKGLNHAHQQKMVHRDLKPQNILVSTEGEDFRLRILDFGLAKTTGIATSSSEVTLDGSIIGTPNYMAPEQAINPSLADIRSDLYSLGCIWFFLLTGKAPFESETPFAVMHAHQNHPLPSLRSIRTDVPIQSEQLISKLLAKAPGSRFQSPAELIDALSSSWSFPKVVVRSSPSRGKASASEIDLSEIVRKIPKKKTGRSYAGLLNAAMILLPPAVLAGVLLSKPHWIPNLNSVLGLIDRGTVDSPPPGEACIVLNDLPADVQIFIDDFPAKFERPRADAQPRISAKPGSYRLSVRRHDQKIYETTVQVQANEILKMSIGNLDRHSKQQNTKNEEHSSTASNRNSILDDRGIHRTATSSG